MNLINQQPLVHTYGQRHAEAQAAPLPRLRVYGSAEALRRLLDAPHDIYGWSAQQLNLQGRNRMIRKRCFRLRTTMRCAFCGRERLAANGSAWC